MRVSKCTAGFWSPIGTADVDFFMQSSSIKDALAIAQAMAGRIFDNRICYVQSIAISENHEVTNADCVMHLPTGPQ